jgi:transcriptional regulator NrdR family protein
MARIRQLRRDDGEVVPFRERRLSDSLHAALRTAGTDDRALADELTSVVVLFLDKYHEAEVPHARDIEEMVIRVLRETGHTPAALAYEAQEKRRRRLESELVVRSDEGETEATEEPFDRQLLAARIAKSREVPESLADEIVTAVEARIVRLELRSVGVRLLEALVDEEMVERGLLAGKRAERRFSIDAHAVAAALRGEGEGRLERRLAAEILRGFALSEIHGADVAQAHRAARIHVFGLDSPLELERLVLTTPLLGLGGTKLSLAAKLLRLRPLVEVVRQEVRAELLFPDLLSWLSAEPEARPDPAAAIELLISALEMRDAYGQPTGPRHLLWLPLSEASAQDPVLGAAADRLLSGHGKLSSVEAVLALEPGQPLRPDPLLEAWIDRASERPHSRIVVRRPGDAPLVPVPAEAPHPLRTSLGGVALNLPLLASDPRVIDIATLTERLEGTLRLAGRAWAERFWLQRSGPKQGIHAVSVALGGPGHVQIHAEGQEVDIELWGLPLALDLIEARGGLRPFERLAAVLRLLSYIDYVAMDDHGGVRFRVRLGSLQDRGVRRRFLDATAEAAAREGDRVLQTLLRRDEEPKTMIPISVPLLSKRNQALLEAPFVERLAEGLALPLSALGEGDRAHLLARLAKETRVSQISLLPHAPEDALFEVQEEMF